MGKIFRSSRFLVIFIFLSAIFLSSHAYAEENQIQRAPGFLPDKFYVGEVTSIVKDEGALESTYSFSWLVSVQIVGDDGKDQTITVKRNTTENSIDSLEIKVGESVVIQKTEFLGNVEYQIYDRYRMWPMAFILAVFFAMVIYLARLKGAGSILGLVISILILTLYIVPKILEGNDPVITSLIGAFFIAVLSLYTAHGFSKKTSISLLATVITLGISAVISIIFVSLTKLSGMGSEETFYLQISGVDAVDLKGLLLAGIIIGVLGVLDDVTSGQAAAVQEIRNANPSLSFHELYRRGIAVGKEHVASLVNTLVLAYAGASLPLFILFYINPNEQPLWVTMNSEFIAEEVIRTLVGSVVLVLAVPIATLLAAYFMSRKAN